MPTPPKLWSERLILQKWPRHPGRSTKQVFIEPKQQRKEDILIACCFTLAKGHFGGLKASVWR